MMSRRTARCRALTLAEVLATVVILAIVLPVAMYGVNQATSIASLARQKSEATALAESKLSELVITSQWQTGNLSGDFGAEWPAYHWQAVVTPWEEANLQQLQLVVTWTARGGDRELTLSTLVYTGASTAGTSASAGGGGAP